MQEENRCARRKTCRSKSLETKWTYSAGTGNRTGAQWSTVRRKTFCLYQGCWIVYHSWVILILFTPLFNSISPLNLTHLCPFVVVGQSGSRSLLPSQKHPLFVYTAYGRFSYFFLKILGDTSTEIILYRGERISHPLLLLPVLLSFSKYNNPLLILTF